MLFQNVFEFQKILALSEPLTEQMQKILQLMKEFINYDLISVFTYDPEKHKCELLVNIGEPTSLVDAVNFTLGKGGTLHSARKKVPVVIRSQFQQNQFSVSSFMAYPIVFRGKTLGVLTLGKYRHRFFNKKHILYIKIFSIYIQNLLIFLESMVDNKQGK